MKEERQRGIYGRDFVCSCVDVSHLALPRIPPPSPPQPPGLQFSVAGSAGDTHRRPGPPCARSSWPETWKGNRE